MLKIILMLTGILSLISGIAGIFLPLVPTTPFILLSAVCFARSSKRAHQWLMNHRVFGRIIHNWEQHRGIEAGHKKRAMIATVISFAISIYLVPIVAVKILLVVMCMGVLYGLSRLTVIPPH